MVNIYEELTALNKRINKLEARTPRATVGSRGVRIVADCEETLATFKFFTDCEPAIIALAAYHGRKLLLVDDRMEPPIRRWYHPDGSDSRYEA